MRLQAFSTFFLTIYFVGTEAYTNKMQQKVIQKNEVWYSAVLYKYFSD